jgi:hypothetical protein
MKLSMRVILSLGILFNILSFAPAVHAEENPNKEFVECVAKCNELDPAAREICLEKCV